MNEKIVEIVKEASTLMLTDAFEVEQKDGCENIVTSSDVAVQEFLRKRLSAFLPGSGFLCEEEDKHDLNHEYTWIIDPIDGTANYSRGIAQCAICVGLRHNTEMVEAVVYIPRTNELFTATKGGGAFMNGRRIHVSDRPFKDAMLQTALSVYYKENAAVCSAIILEAFMQINDIRRFGAAAPEMCYVALGRCEMFFEYVLSPWDYAAASLILQEAGGCMCDLDGNQPDCISKTGLLAANSKENLDRLLAIVKKHRKG